MVALEEQKRTTTVLELPGERDNIVVEEANLALEPELTWVLLGTTRNVRLVHLFKASDGENTSERQNNSSCRTSEREDSGIIGIPEWRKEVWIEFRLTDVYSTCGTHASAAWCGPRPMPGSNVR